MKKILVLFLLLGGTACASKPGSAPEFEARESTHTLNEIESLRQHLGCLWGAEPDFMYPAKGKRYSCVLDRFGRIIFYLEPSDEISQEGKPTVDKITLIWKQWHDNAHVINGKVPASRAIAYVAQRFFPKNMQEDLVDTFMGEKSKTFHYDALKAPYTYEEQPRLNLHQLDIYNRHPEKSLFAFPPPHQYKEPRPEKMVNEKESSPKPSLKSKKAENPVKSEHTDDTQQKQEKEEK